MRHKELEAPPNHIQRQPGGSRDIQRYCRNTEEELWRQGRQRLGLQITLGVRVAPGSWDSIYWPGRQGEDDRK